MIRASYVFILSVACLSVSLQADETLLLGDNFDWGPDVLDREHIRAMGSIAGLSTNLGSLSAIWEDGGRSVDFEFAGEPGPGQGTLRADGAIAQNASIRLPFDFSAEGVYALEVVGSFSHPEEGVRGFWLGAEEANPDSRLLNNQETDKVFMRVAAHGDFLLGSRVDDVDLRELVRLESWEQADQLRLRLVLDFSESMAYAVVENLSRGGATRQTMFWWGQPDWNYITVNVTGESTVELESFRVFRVEQ